MKRARRNRVRTELIKLDRGGCIDEDHTARGFMAEPLASDPVRDREPFTKMSLFNWRINQTASDDPIPLGNFPDLSLPVVSGSLQSVAGASIGGTTYANRAIAEAPFVATRYGLCRYITHRVEFRPPDPWVGDNYHAYVEQIQPVGACSHLGAYAWTNLGQYGAPNAFGWTAYYPAGLFTVNNWQSTESPWPFQGSGCLPVHSMWQPLPWYRPEPRLLRGLHRYGESALLKFSHLEIKVQPLPVKAAVVKDTDYGPLFHSHAVSGTVATGDRLLKCQVEPIAQTKPCRFTVIIFHKRRTRQKPGDKQERVFVPLQQTRPLRGKERSRFTTTRERRDREIVDEVDDIHRAPSLRNCRILFRRTYVIKQRRQQERNLATATDQRGAMLMDSGFPDGVVLTPTGRSPLTRRWYPLGGVADEDVVGTGFWKTAFDLDGLPNIMPTRVVRFKNKLHGAKLSYRDWDSPDAIEMSSIEQVGPSVIANNPAPGKEITGPSHVQLSYFGAEPLATYGDVMERHGETFVTVVTNANLRNYPTASALVGEAPPAEFSWPVRGWQLSHRNDEPACLVHIRNRIWFADVAPSLPRDALTGINVFGVGAVVGSDRNDIPTTGGIGEHM